MTGIGTVMVRGFRPSGRQLNYSMNRRGLSGEAYCSLGFKKGHLLDLIVVLFSGNLASKRLGRAPKSAAGLGYEDIHISFRKNQASSSGE